MSVLDDVLDDLTAEGDQLESWVTPLSDEQWRTPTPAAGWDVATTIAHLAWTDEVVVVAATDPAGWEQLILEAMGDPEGFVDVTAAAAAMDSVVVSSMNLSPVRPECRPVTSNRSDGACKCPQNLYRRAFAPPGPSDPARPS